MEIRTIRAILEEKANTHFQDAERELSEVASVENPIEPSFVVMRISGIRETGIKKIAKTIPDIMNHLRHEGLQITNGSIDTQTDGLLEKRYEVSAKGEPIAVVFIRFTLAQALLTFQVSRPPRIMNDTMKPRVT